LQRKLWWFLDLEPAFSVANIAGRTALLVSSRPLADLREIVVISQRLEAHKEVERQARFWNRQRRFWVTLARRTPTTRTEQSQQPEL
jgi:hypothetical protein